MKIEEEGLYIYYISIMYNMLKSPSKSFTIQSSCYYNTEVNEYNLLLVGSDNDGCPGWIIIYVCPKVREYLLWT